MSAPVSRTESELERLFDLSIDAMCVAGFDGYLRAVNAALIQLLGYTHEELLTRPFMDMVYPGDVERVNAVLAELAAGRDVMFFESRVIRGDGTVRWVEWSTRPQPKERVFYVIGRDITDRRATHEAQAALRRVATLVAHGAQPNDVFSAVTEEVGRLFGSNSAAVIRFDDADEEPALVFVGVSKYAESVIPIGTRWRLDDTQVSSKVYLTGRSARVDTMDLSSPGARAAKLAGKRLGVVSSVASPITVEGRLWGTATAAAREPLPPDAEEKLEKFTELVATAVANAESQAALAQLAEEQAALQRVATLVAQDAHAAVLFAAVANEVAALFRTGLSSLARFEGDEITAVGSSNEGLMAVGTHYGDAPTASRQVQRTGRPARVEGIDWSNVRDAIGAAASRLGVVSTVATPIIVGATAWGSLAIASTENLLPHDTEARLEKFADLVATAVANAEKSAELAASRRRIVAASDEARRRIERDLHDGVQQQLVSLSLELRRRAADAPAGNELKEQLASASDEIDVILNGLVEIARGIHPAILAKGGLEAALKTLARRSAVPVELDARIDVELPDEVEVAAYYVVSEALTNVAKYASASEAKVEVKAMGGTLRLAVCDDGVGGAELGRGSGLIGLQDRVEALGGTIAVESTPGSGTCLMATLPLRSDRVTGS